MARRSVTEALEDELKGMDAPVQESALAALALAMAEQVDAKPSAIMCAELAAVLKTLREMSPPAEVEDEVSALRVSVHLRSA
jgi:hypothetical protein